MKLPNIGVHCWLLLVLMAVLVVAGGLLGVTWAGGELSGGIVAWFVTLGLLAAVVVCVYGARAVFAPLEHLREVITRTRNDGDLARRAEVASASNLAPLAAAYNELIVSFNSIVTRVIFTSQQVSLAAEKMIVDATETADGSKSQLTAAEAAATAVGAMTAEVGEITQSADKTAVIAQSAREHSSHGADIVSEASQEIDRIARSVEQSAQVVATLDERSKAIGGIVKVIREIADQTNLLALNAAIEAARAGEQGRGFAVVADEVRKLAERTSAATREITDMISAIQGETQSAITAIGDGSSQARNGAELARQAAESLQEINRGAQETMENVAVIARAIAQQNDRAKNIGEHVGNIIGMANRNSLSSQNALGEAAQLDYLAMNLKDVGSIFKLGSAGDMALNIHKKMPAVVQKAAQDIGQMFDEAVRRDQISLADLFDQNYVPIPQTKPQKFHTRFDGFTDKQLPALQEPLLDRHREIAYAICCDLNGYVPTHNNRFSQALTGDEKRDFINNRTKRVFTDPVGKRCGAHELPFLLQTYRRDTGEIMHDISAPIFVGGRHWGGFRIGYKTE